MMTSSFRKFRDRKVTSGHEPTDRHVLGRPKKSRTKSKSQSYDGIHNRRDKRFPFAKPRTEPGEADKSSVSSPRSVETSTTEQFQEVPRWKTALMLWLSWNNSYEKLTAKMYKPGTDPAKVEALMDEMDSFRRQEIKMSEELIA